MTAAVSAVGAAVIGLGPLGAGAQAVQHGDTAVTAVTGAPAAAAAPAAALPYQNRALPVAQRVDDLMGRMTLDEKIGQMTLVERRFLDDPTDLTTLGIGGMFTSGDAAKDTSAKGYADLADGWQKRALASRLHIPIITGMNAVHGVGNVDGATVFPHNIGLGATRDTALVGKIGRATAEEMSGIGFAWDESPTVAVTRDDRWGRTYESFGEDTNLVSAMGTAYIEGMQGSSMSAPGSRLANAKHYIADGGTDGGVDRGNATMSEAQLRSIYLPPYRAAVKAGVGAVMVSYSSWNGQRMHGNHYLITDVLKKELGFSGFVVSDYQGINYLDGHLGTLSAEDVREGVNAGIDLVMVPDRYQQFISLLRDEVRAGRVPMSRIDDANRRILTQKFELGLFEKPYADRSWAGTIGSPAHRALASQAVSESMVLLKNQSDVLPIAPRSSKIFVAGRSADNIGYQSGGWTKGWQGGSGAIQPGTTILAGIKKKVGPATTVTYSRDGSGLDKSYNVAVAVVGETPYAEFKGDRKSLALDDEDLATIKTLRATGVPVVVVLVSGRPLDVSPFIDGVYGLVEAWLPGTEGEGVAEVLLGDRDFTGRLPVSWPRSTSQEPVNVGDGKNPLFPFGYGLTYAKTRDPYALQRAVFYSGQDGTAVAGCSDDLCGRAVTQATQGDRVSYNAVDFGGTSPVRVETRIASGAPGVRAIEYRIDSTTGPVIARVPVSSTGGWQSWRSVVTTLRTRVTGVHSLHLTFVGDPHNDVANVEWWRFSR